MPPKRGGNARGRKKDEQVNTTTVTPSINTTQQATSHVIPESRITPLSGDVELSKKKKTKTKMDQHDVRSRSSSSSTISTIPSNLSTSSSNTNSVRTNVPPPNNTRSQINIVTRNPTDLVVNTSEISHQARRYAETRYAFPPFIIKFHNDVDEKLILKSIVNHYTDIYKIDLSLAGHRLKDKRELLLFVENRESFATLYDDEKWPTAIDSLNYVKIKPSHLPAQFSVILRNVPLDIEINQLLDEIKEEYPDVTNAFRISNKNKQPTPIVRLDIKSIKIIDELLSKKFIYMNHLRISVAEYLAPAKVLICSKCFMIGHFRSSCKSVLDVCKTCGTGVPDMKQHKDVCINKQCCVRCGAGHDSNDYRCPEIKSYRAALTKSLLASTDTINNHQVHPENYRGNDHDFPAVNVNRINHPNHGNKSSIGFSDRIDELSHKLTNLEVNLNRIIDITNNSLDQLARAQQVIAKHDHQLQLLQYDTTLQRDFVTQFVSPICQWLVEVIPPLVKLNLINDKTSSYPSITSMGENLANKLPIWTDRFRINESIKANIIKDFNMMNQLPTCTYSNNNVLPHTTTQ